MLQTSKHKRITLKTYFEFLENYRFKISNLHDVLKKVK